MQYRTDRDGNRISILGYGCMRFSKKGSEIDLDKAEQELMHAIRQGVNYLDTAYVYSGSEEAVGKILAKNHCREKINLATKLPHYLIRSAAGAEKKFQEELHRLQTDYIDYYLMHMLNDVRTWEKLTDMGIREWIAEKKAQGQIRHIGFSYHGNTGNFKALLDAYDWDFCQIQYNYLDEHTQAGREGLLYAAAKGIPVIIMEPLRGGRLVNNLSQEAKGLIAQSGYTPAELAFRWLWDQPQITCVLSGMNSLEMLEENLRIADTAGAGAFTPEQKELVEQVKKEINRNMKVGCTGCGYCMPCPNKVDIPMAFHCYNVKYTEGRKSGMWEYLQSTAMRRETSSASQCIRCGKCEKHCPQGIPIREKLQEAVRELETPRYRLIKWAVKTFRIY
ncbi:MAG: aldo/keto reductase [Lachnospiraceae bacterium]|nr:aldo/keto reductase [Lachnospiraceae bacterium]